MTLKMDSINEIMRLCRLCLAKDEVNTPIFEEHGDIKQILLKISACLPVKVSKEDNLPKNICDGCSCKLEMLYHFWSTSANSEKKLIKLLDQIGVNKLSDNNELPMPSSLQSQQHSISSDPVVLKQEVVDVIDSQSVEEDLVHEDLIVSNDQDYLLEQEQIPYQPVEFQFQQDGFETVTAEDESTNVDTKPESESKPRKRRAAAMKALATMESEDEDDPDLIDTKIAKTEEQSDESAGEDPEPTTFVGLPSADDEQPGPSGVGKPSSDAPFAADHRFFFQCNVCWKTFLTRACLKRHAVCHTGEKPFSCDVCQKRFSFRSSATEHKKRCYGTAEVFECDICNRKLKSKKSFHVHRDRHLKKYSSHCSICNEGFFNSAELRTHIEKVHEKVVYECKICGKPLKQKASLQSHMETHTDGYSSKKKFKCTGCDKAFHFKTSLNRHVKTHAGDNLHICHVCGKSYSSKQHFQEHLVVHRGEKPYKCEVCNKSFSKSTNLRIHERSHTGVKPYRCEICGKAFTQRPPLNVHMRYHTGEKPYKCQLCDKGFVTKGSLDAHKKTKHCILYEKTNE